MRILHVANFSLRKYGADLYATDRKISAGLVRNGHYVYDFSYRDVARQESLFGTSRLGTGKLNRKLLQACQTLQPQLVLFGHSELITPWAMAELRASFPATRTALWYVDALFHQEKTAQVVARLPWLDWFFATTGGELLAGFAQGTTAAAFIPNMVDRAVEDRQAFANETPDHDLIFCGRDANDPERRRYMLELQQQASTILRCSFRGCLGNPPVTGTDYLDFLERSAMGLNLSRQNHFRLYSSDRLAQLLGNGLLTFTPRIPGLELLFGEDDLVYFTDQEDLLTKIRYFHEHPERRRLVAANGWKKIHHLCSSERVTQFMLDCIFGQDFSFDYPWRGEIFRSQDASL